MSRRRYYKYRSRGLSKEEKIGWAIASFVFVVVFVAYFIYSFFANCIFEWPIRWDVGTCWDEQKAPAKQKAVEEAIKFAP